MKKSVLGSGRGRELRAQRALVVPSRSQVTDFFTRRVEEERKKKKVKFKPQNPAAQALKNDPWINAVPMQVVLDP